jgi:hypothetical protein
MAKPDGQVGVRLALAQVRQHEQGLLTDREASPSGTALGAALAQRVGQRDQGTTGHGDPSGIGRHAKLPVRRDDLVNRPSTRSFTRSW